MKYQEHLISTYQNVIISKQIIVKNQYGGCYVKKILFHVTNFECSTFHSSDVNS